MKKLTALLAMLIAFALVLAACASGEESGEANNTIPNTGNTGTQTPLTGTEAPLGSKSLQTPGSPQNVPGTALPTESVSATQILSQTEVVSPPETTAGVTSTQTITGTQAAGNTGEVIRGAEILPATGRSQVSQLSNLMGYKVIDRNGALIGTASDYVLNMCEAHILYMVIETDPSIGLKGGNLMLVPYEVVTLGNGQINVDEQSIVLNLDANQVSGAPAITEKPDLTTTDWEQGVRDFWTQIVPLSNLTSGCRVSSTDNSGQTTVTKIAYASQILGTQLQTGTGEGLGQVSDVILVPESGLLRYLVLNPDPSLQVSGSILVPLRAVNINREAAQGQNQIPLVLLVEKKVLQNAPTVSSIPDVSANSWDAKTAGYWSQYVPMQQGQ